MSINHVWMGGVLAGVMALCIAAGCGEETPTVPPSPPDVPLADLLAAPDTAAVDGQRFFIHAYPWRNFMPGPQANPNPPLTIILEVFEVDSLPVAAGIRADYCWAVRGVDVWGAVFTGEKGPSVPAHQMWRRANGGPTWTPGDSISVVVGMEGNDSTLVLVQQRGLVVEAAE